MSDRNEHLDPRDHELARRIGDALESGDATRPAKAGRDEAFLQALDAVRRIESERAGAPTTTESNALWAAIRSDIQPAVAPQPAGLRLAKSALSRRWATASIAAALLLAVAAMWILSGDLGGPVLVAEAGDTMTMYTAPDGSSVRLRPHSRLVRLDADATTFRLEGEGFFDVVRDASRTFAVETVDGRVEVLGTRFNVSTWGGATNVYLEQGRIAFRTLDSGDSVILEPGQKSAITSGVLVQPAADDGAEAMDWLQHEISFEQRALPEIASELEYHFDISLEFPAAMQSETLSGTIPLSALTQTLDDLGLVLGGAFVNDGENTYRFEAR